MAFMSELQFFFAVLVFLLVSSEGFRLGGVSTTPGPNISILVITYNHDESLGDMVRWDVVKEFTAKIKENEPDVIMIAGQEVMGTGAPPLEQAIEGLDQYRLVATQELRGWTKFLEKGALLVRTMSQVAIKKTLYPLVTLRPRDPKRFYELKLKWTKGYAPVSMNIQHGDSNVALNFVGVHFDTVSWRRDLQSTARDFVPGFFTKELTVIAGDFNSRLPRADAEVVCANMIQKVPFLSPNMTYYVQKQVGEIAANMSTIIGKDSSVQIITPYAKEVNGISMTMPTYKWNKWANEEELDSKACDMTGSKVDIGVIDHIAIVATGLEVAVPRSTTCQHLFGSDHPMVAAAFNVTL